MKHKSKIISLFVATIFVMGFCACGSGGKKISGGDVASSSSSATIAAKPAKVFVPAIAPSSFTQEQKMRYMNEHYWDKFDFSDTTFISQADTATMLTSFAVYAVGCVPDSLIDKSMKDLMQKASKSKPMFALGREDPLEKGMATHSSILVWRIPWTEEPGGLQFMGVTKNPTQLSDYHTNGL